MPVVLSKSYPGLYPLCFFLFFVFCFLFFVFCLFVFFYEASTDLWERKSNYLNGSGIFLPFTINNGNRTKWSPIRTVIIRVIIKIVDLSITSTITDRIGRHQFLLQINNRYNFRKKIHLGQTSLVKTMSKVRNSSILEIPQFTFFSRISGCCYGYCDQFCDWWI